MGDRKRSVEWRVIRLRSRGEYLGTVLAPPDEQAARKAAVKLFAVGDIEAQKRLLLIRRPRSR